MESQALHLGGLGFRHQVRGQESVKKHKSFFVENIFRGEVFNLPQRSKDTGGSGFGDLLIHGGWRGWRRHHRRSRSGDRGYQWWWQNVRTEETGEWSEPNYGRGRSPLIKGVAAQDVVVALSNPLVEIIRGQNRFSELIMMGPSLI